jgi:hypothetical protein
VTAVTDAIKTMAGSLQGMAGLRGDYSRYGGSSKGMIHGVLTERDYQVMDEQGIVTNVKSHDWLFTAEDLGRLMPPMPGDRWKVNTFYGMYGAQQDDLELPYEAMEIGNKPCFESHDGQGVMVVVHMKRVPSG